MAEKQSLTDYAVERLGYYVYALRNPIDRKIFYIGKGVGSRVLSHANGVIAADDEPDSMKVQTIKEILGAGKPVESFIIQHGLESNEHAFQTESALYGILSLLDEQPENNLFSLTNIIQPPQYEEHGLMSVDDVLALYGEPADGVVIPHNSVFIKPSHLWHKGMSSAELRESTRGWWRMSEARIKPIRYVFAVPNLVIRAIWEVKPGDWRKQGPGDRGWEQVLSDQSRGIEKKSRWGFDSCDEVGQSKFPYLINKSVAHMYLEGQGKRAAVIYLDDQRVKALSKGPQPRMPFWNVDLDGR